MNDYPVFVGEGLVEAKAGAISAWDTGFLYGLSAFDTVVWKAGCAYFLELHMQRLEHAAKELSIPWPPPVTPQAALSILTRELPAEREFALRMTLTRGVEAAPGAEPHTPLLTITAREVVPPPAGGPLLWVSSQVRVVGDQLGGIKSTNRLSYVLAREEARSHGAWEALLPTHEGDLVEGSISNLFALRDGVLMTPDLNRGCLPGIMRGQLIENLRANPLSLNGRELKLHIDRVREDDLRRASEVFLTNTTGRVIGVRSILGLNSELPGDQGAVALELAARIRQLESDYAREFPGLD